jgi:ABC-type branched-subunit amino acid transport system permease subunit
MVGTENLEYNSPGFWGAVGIDSLLGGLNFLFGFIVGTLIDVAFYKLYQLADPEENKLWILIPFILCQIMFSIFLVVVLTPIFKPESVYGSYFRIALLASQVFMMGYALNRVSKNIYDRENNYSPIVAHITNGGKPPTEKPKKKSFKINPAVF